MQNKNTVTVQNFTPNLGSLIPLSSILLAGTLPNRSVHGHRRAFEKPSRSSPRNYCVFLPVDVVLVPHSQTNLTALRRSSATFFFLFSSIPRKWTIIQSSVSFSSLFFAVRRKFIHGTHFTSFRLSETNERANTKKSLPPFSREKCHQTNAVFSLRSHPKPGNFTCKPFPGT